MNTQREVTIAQIPIDSLRRVQTAKHSVKKKQDDYVDVNTFLAQLRRSKKLQSRSKSAANINSNSDKSSVDAQALIKISEYRPKNVYVTNGLLKHKMLHEIINLNKTPIEFKVLSKLQKRENQIIQHNATSDDRYVSLVNTLNRTKTTYRTCLNKQIIYNAFQECEFLANKHIKTLKSNHNGLTLPTDQTAIFI
jgi:hypothetical protein